MINRLIAVVLCLFGMVGTLLTGYVIKRIGFNR